MRPDEPLGCCAWRHLKAMTELINRLAINETLGFAPYWSNPDIRLAGIVDNRKRDDSKFPFADTMVGGNMGLQLIDGDYYRCQPIAQ